MSEQRDGSTPLIRNSTVVPRLRTWANARDRRNPDGHGKTGTALLRQAADEIERLTAIVAALDGAVIERWEP